jgi:serine/threonine protein kinase
VNLTCGRNPWKQASFEDSTYRAYTRSQDFLKTILPVSDELNDILGRIFTRDPNQRITLAELRARIRDCHRFTEQPTAQLPTLPEPAEHTSTYVCEEEPAMDDEYDYELPLSPDSSDGDSTCSSDEGSLTSSCSSIEDLEEDDFLDDLPEAKTPPPLASTGEPAIYEAEEPKVVPPQAQEYFHPCPVATAGPVQAMPIPVQSVCAPPKFQLHHYVWDMLRYAQPSPPTPPQIHHPIPFHHQVPLFAHMQGCY